MFVGAAMTETGGKNKFFETIFTEERKGGRIEGVSPVYQKKLVKFYVFLIEFLFREIGNWTKSAF
jgi:hypothetical protein